MTTQIHNTQTETGGIGMELWCCTCGEETDARLTNGKEIYPHRADLRDIPRWICDICKNHVGCHHKTKTPTKPLGNIPSDEVKKARIHIHNLIDPVWKSGRLTRGQIYAHISRELGYQYHTGELKTIDEARKVYVIAKRYITRKLKEQNNDNANG